MEDLHCNLPTSLITTRTCVALLVCEQSETIPRANLGVCEDRSDPPPTQKVSSLDPTAHVMWHSPPHPQAERRHFAWQFGVNATLLADTEAQRRVVSTCHTFDFEEAHDGLEALLIIIST